MGIAGDVGGSVGISGDVGDRRQNWGFYRYLGIERLIGAIK